MLKILKCTTFLALFMAPFAVMAQNQPTAEEVAEKMLKAISGVSTLQYKFKLKERVGGSYRQAEQDIKYAKAPLRIYLYSHVPDKGAEVLYNLNVNKDKVYVNPNGFPYYSFYLDPYGSLMRKGRHHTVFELGFDYFGSVVVQIKKKLGNEGYKHLSLAGMVNWNNRDCYKLILDLPDYGLIKYLAKEGETVSSVARKLGVGAYKILELNKLGDYGSLKQGQEILVPNFYAKQIVVYVDKAHFLPIFQEMYDENGLFERYEFHDLKLNPKLSDEEFLKDYKGYGF
jgi:outer membrane lipoprotein-sorting protein